MFEVSEGLGRGTTNLGQLIAPAANDRLNELQVLHTTIQALCDEIKLKGECLDFPGFIETISAFKEVFNFDKASIDIQVEQGINTRRKGGKAAAN